VPLVPGFAPSTPAKYPVFVSRCAALLCLALNSSLSGCGSDSTSPTPLADSVTITGASPTAGTVVIPATYHYNEIGGVILPPQSGLMSVSVTMSLANATPYGQLNVYLLTGTGNADYCGQNLPDSPVWTSMTAGWTTSFTVTGFQVFRLPCTVTGFRVMFHRRNSGALTPTSPAETIAEATMPVSFQIRQ